VPTGSQGVLAGVEDVTVEVQEFSTEGGRVPVRVLKYAKSNLPAGAVRCSNAFCGRGGMSVDAAVSRAIRERKTEYEEAHMCRGFEGSPKGRRYHRSCMHCFTVTVRLRYKEQF
jgi:hypothetical protein